MKHLSLFILLVSSALWGTTITFAQLDVSNEWGDVVHITSDNNTYYNRAISEADISGIDMPLTVAPNAEIIIKGTLLNKETGEPVAAKIIYERLPEGVTIGTTKSHGETGEFEFALPIGYIYGYRAEVEGFLPISDNVDLRGKKPPIDEIEREMLLVPIKVGAVAALNNIFFDFDKSTLKAESYPELKRVVKFLAENRNIEIGLAGHTDSIGTGIYNMKLAERRSRSVANYLNKNNIGKRRIEVQYYGKIRPISTNESDEGRSNNRRVEFIILEK
jgi:outer membrane protein OmpA-like peptidoglycan-associated protein